VHCLLLPLLLLTVFNGMDTGLGHNVGHRQVRVLNLVRCFQGWHLDQFAPLVELVKAGGLTRRHIGD
jgi:hypothetical protein